VVYEKVLKSSSILRIRNVRRIRYRLIEASEFIEPITERNVISFVDFAGPVTLFAIGKVTRANNELYVFAA